MAPKDIARSYPKRGITADVGFRSEPKFCGDGSTEFDGSADYLLADSSFNSAADFSYLVWVNLDSNSGTRTIVGDNSKVTIYLYSNKIGVWNLWGTLGAGEYAEKQATNNALTNTWVHIGVSYTYSSNTLKLYIDGVDQPTVPSPAIGPGSTSGKFEIGARDNGGSPIQLFDGNIAGVKRFDVALTQAQIRELYNNPGLIVPTGVSSSNLKRYYKLETNFNDSGADSENLTSVGSPSFTVNRPQLPRGLDLARGAAQARVYTGRALDQDGSVDRLQGTNFTDATATACTVSFWMYQRDGGPGRIIHNFGGGATAVDRFIATMNAGSFFILGEVSAGVRSGYLISSLPLNQWHHVVFVLDGNGTTALDTVILYLNGEKYDSPSNYSFIWDTTTFDIGGTSHGYQNQLIAGVKVFNTKLTDAQARELYHYPEQVLPTGVSASNLRRYYPLSDYNDTGGTGGRYFQDMGADGEPMEDIGSASMEFAQPVPCPQLGLQQSATRLYYDGTTGTTYNVEVTGHSLNLPSFSIAFWGFFQSNNPNTTSCCLDTSGGGTFQYFINSTAGNLTVYNGAPTATFNGAVPRDEWVHVVITGDGSSPYIKCYVNGVEKTIDSGSLSTAGLVATNYYLFSRSANSLSHTGFGNNYSIYDSNLGASEVLELYNQGIGYDPRTNVGNYTSASSLIRLYKFDDLTTVKDYSGNNAHADVNGTFKAASFPENASGSTLVGDFSMKRKGVSVLNLGAVSNAANEYALSAKDSAFLPSFANGGAFSCFFRLQQLGEFSSIFINDDYGSGTQHRFAVYLNSANKVYFELGDGVSARANPNTTGTISDSDWHHFAFTVDYGGGATTTIKLFLDGVLDSTSTATTLAGVPNATALRFGDYVTSGSNEMNGPIACPKFYQVTLSDNEIEQIYRSDLRLIKGLENV